MQHPSTTASVSTSRQEAVPAFHPLSTGPREVSNYLGIQPVWVPGARGPPKLRMEKSSHL